ncbi:MAG: hypothetical protein Q9162_007632 [Coniocarpon cinnabarinum]
MAAAGSSSNRRLGEWLCFLALLHSGGIFVFWYDELRPAGSTLNSFLSHKIILLGLLAFICYELLYLTSLGCVRQRLYEYFLASHVLLQAAALGLVFFHHRRSRIHVGLALVIFVADRAMRIGWKTQTFEADVEIIDARESWLRVRSKVSDVNQTVARRALADGWHATQHVYLSVPSLSYQHILQAHPFTIGSPAPTPPDQDAKYLDLFIRAHDGFTRDLLNCQMRRATTSVNLDGPYGSTHLLDTMASKSTVITVAAGTGVAVAIPFLHHLACQRAQHYDLEHAFNAASPQRLVLILVVRSRALGDALRSEYLDQLEKMGVELVVAAPTEEVGKPDMTALLQENLHSPRLIPFAKERGSIGVVCSAPDALNRTVRNFCAHQAWLGLDIDVAIEKFGW